MFSGQGVESLGDEVLEEMCHGGEAWSFKGPVSLWSRYIYGQDIKLPATALPPCLSSCHADQELTLQNRKQALN